MSGISMASVAAARLTTIEFGRVTVGLRPPLHATAAARLQGVQTTSTPNEKARSNSPASNKNPPAPRECIGRRLDLGVPRADSV